MSHHSKSFKASAVLLAISLAAGGTIAAQPIPYDVPAATSQTGGSAATASSSTPFSDVKAGHWAEKHISKLAFQNIIVGNNGLFRPADSVTRQEAIVMAVRFAGLEGQLNRDEAVVFPSSFKVDKYFIPYVHLAFEKNLINRDDEFALADQSPESGWGNSKASREWVTKLIVNAIGKGEEAKSQADKPLSFADASSVSKGFAGYINEAVSLNLVNGVAGNRFDPKGAVNRAMMATLLSRAESQFPIRYDGQTEGILTSLSDGSIGIYTPTGEQTYSIGTGTVFARFDSEQLAAASAMVRYAKVSLIASNGKAQYIELISTEPQVETISGTFVKMIPASHKLWIQVGDDLQEIRYDDKLEVINGNGNVLDMTALTADASVKVTRDKFRQSPIAISVQVVNAPVNKTASGTVQATGTASLTVDSNGTSETWNVSPDVIILKGSTVVGSIKELKAGDQVTYEVKNNAIIRINVTAAVARMESGAFAFYNADSKTITYVKDKKYETKRVTDTAVVNIEGLPTAGLTDLQSGDQLDLTINDSDQVTKVSVTNRKVEIAAGVEIRSYDAQYKILNVVDSKGNPFPLKFTENSQIEFNGTAYTLASAASSGLLSTGRKITISYTGDTIVKVQLSYRYAGTVVSVNASTSKLTLSIGGNLLTLTMQLPFVEVYGKTTAALSDIQVGDTVTAVMNQDQDKVIGIYAHRIVQMKIAGITTSTNRIALQEGANSVVEHYAGGLEMLDEAGSKTALANFAAGNVVNVSFIGKTPSSVQRVAVNLGTVQKAEASQLTIVGYDGRTVSLPLGTTYTIVRGGVSSNSYTALQAGDRVEVRKDAKGNVRVTALAIVPKKFWKYDSASGVLQTKRASIDDANYKFSLSGVVLTSGGAVISPLSLKDGDELNLYYSDDKLIEIEKK